jgi:hypothetical protein
MVVVVLFSFDLSSTMGSSCMETPRRRIYAKAATLKQESLCITLANMWQGGQELTALHTQNSKDGNSFGLLGWCIRKVHLCLISRCIAHNHTSTTTMMQTRCSSRQLLSPILAIMLLIY